MRPLEILPATASHTGFILDTAAGPTGASAVFRQNGVNAVLRLLSESDPVPRLLTPIDEVIDGKVTSDSRAITIRYTLEADGDVYRDFVKDYRQAFKNGAGVNMRRWILQRVMGDGKVGPGV